MRRACGACLRVGGSVRCASFYTILRGLALGVCGVLLLFLCRMLSGDIEGRERRSNGFLRYQGLEFGLEPWRRPSDVYFRPAKSKMANQLPVCIEIKSCLPVSQSVVSCLTCSAVHLISIYKVRPIKTKEGGRHGTPLPRKPSSPECESSMPPSPMASPPLLAGVPLPQDTPPRTRPKAESPRSDY